MMRPQERTKRHTRNEIWLALVFFALCYGYLWLVVKPHLIYHGFGTLILDVPVFATGWEPLRDSLSVPGGLAVYAYGLLSQGYYYSWLGAMIIVLTVLGLWWLARQHYACAGHSHAMILPYLPAVIVLLLYSRYHHPLAACLTSSMGLLSSLIFEKMPSRRIPASIVAFCILVGISYWFAGAGAAFVFAAMTVVHLLIRRQWLPGLLAPPAAAVIVWGLAEYVFLMSPKQAFVTLTPFCREWTDGMDATSMVLVVLLYAFVPVTVFIIHLGPRASTRSAKTRESPLMRLTKLVAPAIPVVVLVTGLYLTYDGVHRQIVTMNALSRQGRWSEVLALADRMPRSVYNIYCNHDIDRALFHTGRLAYDLFRFPQNPQALLLTHEDDESCMTQLKMCDAFLELGNVDLAQKLAGEFVVAKGNLGIVLEKLAWINIIKGQEDTARMYLNALRRDLIYRGTADSMLHGLDNGFGPREAAYIRRINSYMRRQGDAGKLDRESIEGMLTRLLEQNPANRMAFEYLMACYLLAGQIDKVEANIGRLQELGYAEIPTLYEEAILIGYGARRQRLDLNKLPVDRQTIERHKRFVQLSDSMQPSNREMVLRQLLQEFGTSYFFYYQFAVLTAESK